MLEEYRAFRLRTVPADQESAAFVAYDEDLGLLLARLRAFLGTSMIESVEGLLLDAIVFLDREARVLRGEARGGLQPASVSDDQKRQRESEENSRQVSPRLESPESPPKPEEEAAAASPPPAHDAPLSPSGHWAMGPPPDSDAAETPMDDAPSYRSLAASSMR